MKYTLQVNQAAAFSIGIQDKVDLIDLCLFDAFKSFANSARCEKMIDEGGIWFWVAYGLIIDDIPLSGIKTKDAIYRRMMKLKDAGLIVFHPNNQKMTKTFFRWGANYDAMDRKDVQILPTDEKPKVSQDLRMKNRRGADEKPKVPTDEKPYYYTTNNNTTNTGGEEREAEKDPTPTDFDNFMDRVNSEAATTIEAKKEKNTPVPAAPSFCDEIRKELDILEREFKAPTHVVTAVDGQTLPGALVTTVEGLNLEQTTRETAATASILKATGREIQCETADDANDLITEWAACNMATIENWYNRSKRVISAVDLQNIITKFCGTYANHSDSGKRLRFLSDPVLFFRNQCSGWLIDQNKYDSTQSSSKFAIPTEQKSNLPKSIRRY